QALWKGHMAGPRFDSELWACGRINYKVFVAVARKHRSGSQNGGAAKTASRRWHSAPDRGTRMDLALAAAPGGPHKGSHHFFYQSSTIRFSYRNLVPQCRGQSADGVLL